MFEERLKITTDRAKERLKKNVIQKTTTSQGTDAPIDSLFSPVVRPTFSQGTNTPIDSLNRKKTPKFSGIKPKYYQMPLSEYFRKQSIVNQYHQPKVKNQYRQPKVKKAKKTKKHSTKWTKFLDISDRSWTCNNQIPKKGTSSYRQMKRQYAEYDKMGLLV